MVYWTLLHHTIEKTLGTGRVGTAVFARCTVAITAGIINNQNGTVHRSLAIMGDTITTWLAAETQNVCLIGTREQACLSLSLECTSGATALLSVSTTARQPHIDLTLLGTEGAIYHQEAIHLLAGDRFFEAPILPQQVARLQQLQRAIEQAATSGQPVSLEVRSLS